MPLLLAFAMLVVAVLIKLTLKGPTVDWSDRIACKNTRFCKLKFRALKIRRSAVAMHLLPGAERYVRSVGSLPQETSMGEQPEVFSEIAGQEGQTAL